MGFFKDFKDDLTETANGVALSDMKAEQSDDLMVNTLDADPELAAIVANLAIEEEEVEETYIGLEKEAIIATGNELIANSRGGIDDADVTAETAVITQGLTVTGNLDSDGSIDIYGTVIGNVVCKGKLSVSGMVEGDLAAGEIIADNAQLQGDMNAAGSVKIGQGTVVIGNINATAAVIAGAVKGNIDVHGPVIVDSTAVVIGDVKSKTVQINNGAAVDGKCSQCYSDININDIFAIKDKKAK